MTRLTACVAALATTLALRSTAAQVPATPETPPTRTSLVVGNTDLTKIRWVTGNWKATNGTATRYERFRYVNDSTLLEEVFADEHWRQPSSQLWVELRNHRITTRGAAQWLVNGLDTVKVTFRPSDGGENNLIWQRQGEHEWIAVESWPPTVDKPARVVTWHMRKVR